jgi:RNA polymerase sigma-70 factor (ECF subfamily)
VELYYWHDLTIPEIAAALGIPDGTVKSRLNRARRDLRRELVRLQVGPELVESTMMQLPAIED